jgi:hypothetical protein
MTYRSVGVIFMDARLLERQRLALYQLNSSKRVSTFADATRYINRFGFCWLFAPRDRKLELPSLFEAVKGKRDAHIDDWDKDSDKVWTWKNDLPAAKRAYYGKALAGKPVFVSLQMLPYVIAALGEEDVAGAYERGMLSYDARRVYDALAQFGAQPTQNLKRTAGFVGKEGNTRYHHALDELQTRLIAAPMGATNEGMAWASQIFDLVAHWFESQAREAKQIDVHTARCELIERYLKTILAAPPDVLARLFRIPRPELKPLLDEMVTAKKLRVQDGWVMAKTAKF